MNVLRRGLSLLEILIASAIFIGIAGLATTSLATGSNLKTTISARNDADGHVAQLVANIAKELRLADIIALDASNLAATELNFSFNIVTGFNTTDPATMEQVTQYSKIVTYRFRKNEGDQLTGTLTRLEQASAGGTATSLVLSDRLAWSYRPASGTPQPGFAITQINASSTMIGNRIQISAFARPVDAVAGGTSEDPTVTPITTASATVQLRASMFDGFGVTAPVITSASSKEGNIGTALRYDITATHYPSSYAASGLPAGLSVDTHSGTISGTPTGSGTTTASIIASNSAGSDTRALVFTIRGAIPVITSAAQTSIQAGSRLVYVIEASNSPTSYAASSLPTGLSYVSGSHSITGTVTTEGTYLINLAATNSAGTGYGVLVLTVTAAALQPPVITSPTTANGMLRTSFTYQIQATNSPTSFAASGLPAGLSLNAGSGVISGTPTASGVSAVTLTATNASGSGTAALTLSITSQPSPVITSLLNMNATAGTALAYTITASNSPTSFSATSLPTWLTGPSTSGVLSGTPGDGDTGTKTCTITATNAYGSGSATLTITVAQRAAPTITSVLTGGGMVGTVFNYQITASNSPSYFGASGLPAGLTVSSTSGLISGTPTAAGTTNVTLSAVNGGGTGTATLVLTFTLSSAAPTVTLGANTGNGTNFQVIGTVAAAANATLATNSFQWSSTQSGFTVARGWVSSEAGSGSRALGTNEFLISGRKPSGSLTLTASIGDTTGRVGSASRTY